MKKALSLLLFLSATFPLTAQEINTREFNKAFRNADMFYYYDENYSQAASIYEPLLKSNPEHHNLAAKLGICYLNLEGRNAEALRLLKKASQNVAENEKEYKQTGDKAPWDTWLYLAIAYQRNDSLEKAAEVFKEARKKIPGADLYQEEYIDLQVRNARYALEMKKRPLRIISELFAPWLEEYPGACHPVLAKNDSVFVFTVKDNEKTQIYCSYKRDTWERPSNITKQVGGYDRLYTNSITGNGNLLILFMDDGGDGNLYYSQRKDTTWTRIKSVGRHVNTIYWESHGFVTPDGNTMYFSSNRPEGQGELDIWTSQRADDGSWERPVNCGNIINTPYDENAPFFDPVNNALIFSSTGHISMGGYDIYRSTLRSGYWTQPVGMPYAFNDVEDNIHFILNNNAPGFIASRYEKESGSKNIFAIVAVDPADEITKASGTIELEDGMDVNPTLSSITVKNIKTGATIKNIPVANDGTFNFSIKPGEYQVVATHQGYQTDTIDLSLPLYFTGNYLPVNPSLAPEKVSSGEFLSINNILFDFDSYAINDEALPNLQLLMDILINYPELTIEVAGYTDAVGAAGYNMILADRRAQSVINFFTLKGIDDSRFIKKAFGESNFVAVNRNPDGTDNPEGRKYNRRVTFGIVDPKTDVVIRHETFTPDHLRQPHTMKYSIILAKTKQSLGTDYFGSLIDNDMLFVRAIPTDSLTIYSLGVFYNRADAAKYLKYARERGLRDAYIVNQYELENELKGISKPPSEEDKSLTLNVYTIQLKATRNPLDISEVFPGYKGVKEIVDDDGYYKYLFGEFKSITEAKAALKHFLEKFDDAFIRKINMLVDND